MQRIHFAAVCLASLFILACGSNSSTGGESSKGFTVKIDGKESALDKKTSAAVIRKDLREGHFLIASHEVDMSGKSILSLKKTDSPDQLQVTFGLKGEGDFNQPIKPGEYSGNKITWVSIRQFKNGSHNETGLAGSGNNMTGSIKIASVTDDAISGTIDVVSGDKAVKGDFQTKIIK